MNPWPFVIAAYAVTIALTAGLLLWAHASMRRAEADLAEARRLIERYGAQSRCVVESFDARALDISALELAMGIGGERLHAPAERGARREVREAQVGLGLTIARQFTELHGDRLSADDPAVVCGIGDLGGGYGTDAL